MRLRREAIVRRATAPLQERRKSTAMQRLGYARVFGIGAPRTGTSSLGVALSQLGFRHKSWDPELWECYEHGRHERIFEAAEGFESFDDGPWNGGELFQELDRRFPDSKFVLTMREESAWLRSHERHFSSEGARLIPPQYWIHDYDSKREQILDAYRTRNAGVRRYFAGRPDDLLVLDICRGEGWEPLCAFLGLEPPGRGFPSLNASR